MRSVPDICPGIPNQRQIQKFCFPSTPEYPRIAPCVTPPADSLTPVQRIVHIRSPRKFSSARAGARGVRAPRDRRRQRQHRTRSPGTRSRPCRSSRISYVVTWLSPLGRDPYLSFCWYLTTRFNYPENKGSSGSQPGLQPDTSWQYCQHIARFSSVSSLPVLLDSDLVKFTAVPDVWIFFICGSHQILLPVFAVL